jgi:hypothetical protein
MKSTKKETTPRQQKPAPRAKKADGESDVLTNLAAWPYQYHKAILRSKKRLWSEAILNDS